MNEPHPEKASEETNAEALDSRETQQKNSAISRKIEASYQFTGPLPPPVVLEQYNRILPDAADRIVSMAEREQDHRHKMQEKLIDAQIFDVKQERGERRLGQIFGLSIGVVSIVSGSITAVLGAPIAGGVIGSAGVVGLVSVFVLGRREQQDTQAPPQLESSEIEDDASTDRLIM